ncbi:MAG: N-acetyltransferase [Gemella sp.]|nr:N-acetyltransferase [Gemella sp.]
MIRLCREEDIKKLRELCILTFRETFGDNGTSEENLLEFFETAYNVDVLRKTLEDKNSETYVYEKDGELLAYLKVNVSTSQTEEKGEEYLEIQRIYVKKSAKGQGIGKELMNLAEKLAKEKSKSKMWLGVWENNFAAQEFYKKQDFEKTGEHKFIVGEEADTDWIMEKTLS